MAAIDWTDIKGQKFSGDEARDASDFGEIVWNHGLSADDAFKMFLNEGISVGKRLYLAVKASEDNISVLLMMEKDARILTVIKERFKENRLEDSGGIIIAR